MPKQPVSLTLEEGNLVWLRGVSGRAGDRSLSETVDRIVSAARAGAGSAGTVASVVGTIDIDESDPDLLTADAVIRDQMAVSLNRPFLARERKPPKSPKGRRG